MTVFDDELRTNLSPRRYSEGTFDYLNTSARSEAENIRALIEEWVENFPEQERRELVTRLQDGDDYQHLSAFFELTLHELFRRAGFDVVVHPELDGTRRRPDFCVTEAGQQFIVEAALASGVSVNERANDQRQRQILDAINSIGSPDFFLSIESIQQAASSPPVRQVRAWLEVSLNQLNVEQLYTAALEQGLDALPLWRFEHDGWIVEMIPIPKSPESRGDPGVRPIGATMEGIEYVDSASALKRAITRKAGAYGQLDRPFVIAVNALQWHVDEIAIGEALFGTETVTYRRGDPYGAQLGRRPDGALFGPDGPRNTRVSGVLVVRELTPWTLARVKLRLFHNPWAAYPLSHDLFSCDQMIPVMEEARMVLRSGTPAFEILGLSPSWPEER